MEKKLNRKSASNWEEISERTLIEVWRENISGLRGCRKNSHIVLEMAQDLEKQGYVYSVLEIKNKMHNLTSRYRKEKQKIGPTGGSPSNWNLFEEMQTLLAPYKSYNTEGLLVDSINNINSQSLCSISSSPLSSPPAFVASPLPSLSIPATSPLPSPPIPASSPMQSPPVLITSPLSSPSIPASSPMSSPPVLITSPLSSSNTSDSRHLKKKKKSMVLRSHLKPPYLYTKIE